MIDVERRRALALLAGLMSGTKLMLGSDRALASGNNVDVHGLAATLTIPQVKGPVPAVVIIAGSGPTDRDGNSSLGLNTNSYKLLAEGLAAAGIASLRYDKRGIAGSKLAAAGLREEDFTIETFVDDAVLVAKWLRRRQGVRSVSLIGHSEGALISLLAARDAGAAAAVLLCGTGRKLGEVIREQLSRPGTPPQVAKEAFRIIAALEKGEQVSDLPKNLEGLFRPGIQPFLRSELVIDPAALAAALAQPLMIVGGGADIQVARADFDRLVAARPDATALWLADMAHTLKAVGADPKAQGSAYADPALPLERGLVPAVASFVLSRG